MHRFCSWVVWPSARVASGHRSAPAQRFTRKKPAAAGKKPTTSPTDAARCCTPVKPKTLLSSSKPSSTKHRNSGDKSPSKLATLTFPGTPTKRVPVKEIFGCRIYTVADRQKWRVVPPGTRVDKGFSWKARPANDAWRSLVEFVRTHK